MFLSRQHLRDHNPLEFAADFLRVLDLNAEHRQTLGEFLGRPVKINVLLEPIECYLHLLRKLTAAKDSRRDSRTQLIFPKQRGSSPTAAVCGMVEMQSERRHIDHRSLLSAHSLGCAGCRTALDRKS